MQKVEINGEPVDVYTAAERDADIAAAKKEVTDSFNPKLTEAEKEKTRLEELLAIRSGEIKGIRKLSDDAVSKLTAAERVIYENGIEIAEANKRADDSKKAAHESAIISTIRTKVGNDEKLYTEAKKMYDILGLTDNTPDEMNVRVDAAIGALGRTQPDLLAAAGMGGGRFEPPVREAGAKSYAETEQGKQGAAELGIQLEYTDAQKKALGL